MNDREEERDRCVAVCETQAEMLDKAGAHEQAKGAQLCANVLGLLTPIAPTHRHKVLGEVDAERTRQDAKWGEQNHPDVDRVLTDREGGCSIAEMAEWYSVPTATAARDFCDIAAKRGGCTWAHILVEEVAEAIEAATLEQQDAIDTGALRKELVQVAAVAVSWIEAIDRRKGAPTKSVKSVPVDPQPAQVPAANDIQARRKALGWSMQNLADRARVFRQEVTALEHDRIHTAAGTPLPADIRDRVERALSWGETQQRLRPQTRKPEDF